MATGGLHTDAGRTGIGIEFETDSPTHIASFSNSCRRLGDIWVAKIRGRAHLEVKLAMSVLIDKLFISQERRQRVDMPQSPRSSERWPARPFPPRHQSDPRALSHGMAYTCTHGQVHVHVHVPSHIFIHTHPYTYTCTRTYIYRDTCTD